MSVERWYSKGTSLFIMRGFRPLPIHTNPDIFETVNFLSRILVNGILNSLKKIRIRVDVALVSYPFAIFEAYVTFQGECFN